jgi:hypothetical protein
VIFGHLLQLPLGAIKGQPIIVALEIAHARRFLAKKMGQRQ